MARFLAFIALIVVAPVAPAQLIASAGFNDQTGLNSNPTPNSPYNVNNVSINGQGAAEPGWLSTWTFASSSPTVVNSGQAEGDGAANFVGTSGAERILALPLSSPPSGSISIQMQFKIANAATGGNGVNFYMRQSANSLVGPNWQASGDGHFRVVNDNESGSGALTDTGILWSPGAYQTVQINLFTATRTWLFSVNGTVFNPGSPLTYRESPTFIDEVDYGNGIGGLDSAYMDALIIAAVPEPSSFALLASVAGFAIWRRRRSGSGSSAQPSALPGSIPQPSLMPQEPLTS